MEDYYYRQVIEKSSFGYANHRIVLDEENNPIDYIFLEVNGVPSGKCEFTTLSIVSYSTY